MKKRLLLVFIAITILFALLLQGCRDSEDNETAWAFYIYLCGSDLESDKSEGSNLIDTLEKMVQSGEMPKEVCFVIQTGGSTKWRRTDIDYDKIDRFYIDSNGLIKEEALPLQSMSDSKTLEDFIKYCRAEHPAEHSMLSFWDHGAGTIGGLCFDENYEGEKLTLDKMLEAFMGAADNNEKLFDIIHMDVCLMASVDTANICQGYADYLLASQETAIGLDYDTVLKNVKDIETVEPLALCKDICDIYIKENVKSGKLTESVIDLNEIDAVLQAFDEFGLEAISKMNEDSDFYAKYQRAVLSTLNFARDSQLGISMAEMIDLGDLAYKTGEFMTTSKKLLDAIDKCVLYKVGGFKQDAAHGLSCYAGYNKNNLDEYIKVGAATAFKCFYSLGMTGEVDDSEAEYLVAANVDITNIVSDIKTDESELEGCDIYISDDNFTYIEPGKKNSMNLIEVDYLLSVNYNGREIILGDDNQMVSDWEDGIFSAYFNGYWGHVNGVPVCIYLDYADDKYLSYLAPVMINGADGYLQIGFSYDTSEWVIEGFYYYDRNDEMEYTERTELQDVINGMEITFLSPKLMDDGYEEIGRIIYSDETIFTWEMLPDGNYSLIYEMWKTDYSIIVSQWIDMELKDGWITYK